jgi:cytochrome b561
MGDTSLDKLAKGIHYLLYAVLFLLPVTGITIIFNSKAGAALWAGDGSLLPKEHGFKDVFSHEIHEQLVNVLIALVVVHMIGAIYHQFIKKDGLMNRMAFPKKD